MKIKQYNETWYIAEDGASFKTEEKCRAHEKKREELIEAISHSGIKAYNKEKEQLDLAAALRDTETEFNPDYIYFPSEKSITLWDALSDLCSLGNGLIAPYEWSQNHYERTDKVPGLWVYTEDGEDGFWYNPAFDIEQCQAILNEFSLS